MKKVLWLIVCLMTMVVFSMCGNSAKNDESSDEAKTNTEAFADSVKNEALATASWEITSEVDEMSETKTFYGELVSNNSITQDFPYGDTKARILVRKTKKYGNEVMICVSSGQICGNEYQGSNYIEVKFDSAPSKKYRFTETEDGSSEVVFIDKSKDFIANCKKAKSIKMEIPLFQGGRPLFTFSTDKPLSWNL